MDEFITILRLRYLISKQHQTIQSLLRNQEDLKRRIVELMEMDAEDRRWMKRENHVRELEKAKNEAMNKLRKAQSEIAGYVRKQRHIL